MLVSAPNPIRVHNGNRERHIICICVPKLFVLLRPRDRYRKSLTGQQLRVTAIKEEFNINSLRRWGRLCLPNGQVARSLFSEKERSERTRISRNVKVMLILTI